MIARYTNKSEQLNQLRYLLKELVIRPKDMSLSNKNMKHLLRLKSTV